MELTHLSLFSGIGGIDLAAEWAGFETIAFVECNDYAQQVLRRHWPDVPILEDVRNVTKERIEQIMAISQSYDDKRDNKTMGDATEESQSQNDGAKFGSSSSTGGRDVTREQFKEPITLITGGVPCQPASVAGKRRGKEDDRWLWPEAIRILSEIKPTWAVFENPTGILTLEDGVVFNDLLSGMEAEGYEVQPVIVPACAVNAPHRRDRCFIVAHNNTIRCDMWRIGREGIQRGGKPCCEVGAGSQDVADTNREGLQESARRGFRSFPSQVRTSERCKSSRGITEGRYQWAVEPELGRVANGISHRVDRLRCLGNSVVPAQIYPILKAIADIERGNDETL